MTDSTICSFCGRDFGDGGLHRGQLNGAGDELLECRPRHVLLRNARATAEPGPGREGAPAGSTIPRGPDEMYERMSREALHIDLARSLATSAMRDALRDFDDFAQLLHQNLRHQGTPNARSLGRILATWLKRLRELVDALPAAIAERSEREGPIVGSDNVSSVAPPASDNAASVPQSTPRDDRSGPITETPAPSPDELASSAEEDAKAWEEIALSFDRVIMSTALELNLSKSLVETVAERVWRASREEGRFGRVTLLLDRALARAELVRKTSDTLAGEPLDFFARRPSDAIEVARALVEAWKFVDAIVRVDVPELVAEVKRLRGWS